MCSLRMGSVRVAQFSNLCFLPPSSAILISHVFSGVGYLQPQPLSPAFIPPFPISPAIPCSQIIKYSASCNVNLICINCRINFTISCLFLRYSVSKRAPIYLENVILIFFSWQLQFSLNLVPSTSLSPPPAR